MFDDLSRSVIMDVVIPGFDPWDAVLRNRHIWHFVLHNFLNFPRLSYRLGKLSTSTFLQHLVGSTGMNNRGGAYRVRRCLLQR